MFDSPFDFFALVIAIVAFIFARKAFNQATTLRARLDAIEAAGLQAGRAPPPLTPLQESPGVAAEQPTTVADAQPVAPTANDQTVAAHDVGGGTTPTPPPLPQPG